MSEWDKITELVALTMNEDEKLVIQFIENNMDDLTPNLSEAILDVILLTEEYVKDNIAVMKKFQENFTPSGLRAELRFEMLKMLIEGQQ